uniref:Uncharacterized protein n=2 Tax=Human herpesvirus 2 TaxID=10310 RepID=A0A481T602_HHV2|nr:hypothetical protein [Human alphaherpesvirus 2]QBH78347.1 hypothetical protein [Human alphaherpesvirus 2]
MRLALAVIHFSMVSVGCCVSRRYSSNSLTDTNVSTGRVNTTNSPSRVTFR